jgi:hypothetical protein
MVKEEVGEDSIKKNLRILTHHPHIFQSEKTKKDQMNGQRWGTMAKTKHEHFGRRGGGGVRETFSELHLMIFD